MHNTKIEVKKSPNKISRHQTQTFAELSGDNNPLHLIDSYARRLQFGGAVVHGMHLVLAALDLYAHDIGKFSLSKLSVKFRNPIKHLQEFDVVIKIDNDMSFSMAITSNGLQVASVEASLGSNMEATASIDFSIPPFADCKDRSWDELNSYKGKTSLYYDTSRMAGLFPNLCKSICIWQAAGLLSLTRIVGNICPGLHSIFYGFEIHFAENNDVGKSVEFEVVELDDRFDLVNLTFSSNCFFGKIQAKYRAKEIAQPSYIDIKSKLLKPQLSGKKVLVIGGSRGLGEIITKLCAAHQAEVNFTFYRGEEDASRILNEISVEGYRCRASRLDVGDTRGSGWEQIKENGPYHLLFYFATPPIELNIWREWDVQAFENYCRYYIHNFAFAAKLLKPHTKAEKIVVVQPSTSFLNSNTHGATEYSAAKAGLEILARALSTAQSVFLTPRISPLLTDQTATVDPETLGAAVPAMVSLLDSSIRTMKGLSANDI